MVHNILCLQLYVVFASFFNTIIGLLMKVSGEKCEKKNTYKKGDGEGEGGEGEGEEYR